jgi:hypothetical protein
VVHYNADERLGDALTLLREAYVIGAAKVDAPKLVRREIVSGGQGAGQKPRTASP